MRILGHQTSAVIHGHGQSAPEPTLSMHHHDARSGGAKLGADGAYEVRAVVLVIGELSSTEISAPTAANSLTVAFTPAGAVEKVIDWCQAVSRYRSRIGGDRQIRSYQAAGL